MLCPRCGTEQSGEFYDNCGFQLNIPTTQMDTTPFQKFNISSPEQTEKSIKSAHLGQPSPWYREVSSYFWLLDTFGFMFLILIFFITEDSQLGLLLLKIGFFVFPVLVSRVMICVSIILGIFYVIMYRFVWDWQDEYF